MKNVFNPYIIKLTSECTKIVEPLQEAAVEGGLYSEVSNLKECTNYYCWVQVMLIPLTPFLWQIKKVSKSVHRGRLFVFVSWLGPGLSVVYLLDWYLESCNSNSIISGSKERVYTWMMSWILDSSKAWNKKTTISFSFLPVWTNFSLYCIWIIIWRRGKTERGTARKSALFTGLNNLYILWRISEKRAIQLQFPEGARKSAKNKAPLIS